MPRTSHVQVQDLRPDDRAEDAAIPWAGSVMANEALRDINGPNGLDQLLTQQQVLELTVPVAYQRTSSLLQGAFGTHVEDTGTSKQEHR